MATTAAHLTDHVLPGVRLRQWVVTFPEPLPRLLAWQPGLLGRVLSDVARELRRSARERSGRADGRAGVVAVVQTFTGDLRRYVHVHALVPDAVVVQGAADGGGWVASSVPTQDHIQAVAARVAGRVVRTCRRWASELGSTDEEVPEEALDGLARLGEQAVGRAVPRAERPAARARRWLGSHEGFEVHAEVTVEASDREGRERLCRYVARPALSLRRLSLEPDGRVSIDFKTPWRSGRTGTVLDPGVFVLRLASLQLPPRVNAVRYYGVFAPASPLRAVAVPSGPRPRRRPWVRWAVLIERVFERRPDLCPTCGLPMTPHATVQGDGGAWRVLRWLSRHGNLARDGPGVVLGGPSGVA